MNKFAVLCLGLAGMAMTVQSSECWDMCTIFKSSTATTNGVVKDIMAAAPAEYPTECLGGTTTCGSGSSCKTVGVTMSANALGTDTKIVNQYDLTGCISDLYTSSKGLCDDAKKSIESANTNLENVSFECSAFKAYSMTDDDHVHDDHDDFRYSSAAGFGFGAFLVTIIYLF